MATAELAEMVVASNSMPEQVKTPGPSEMEVVSSTLHSPATPSSEASKSTCSVPPLEMDDDTPASSPVSSNQHLTPKMALAMDMMLGAAAAKKLMFEQYQPWVLSTYGDAAKTKTITAKKYTRIVSLLKLMGADKTAKETPSLSNMPEPSGSDAAKFRLWVKSKGFHLGPPAGHPEYDEPHSKELLYLPTGTDKVDLPHLSFHKIA
jgi:hypothetical protein